MIFSRTARLVAAFAAVYVVWGSTYLAIRVGVLADPPGLFNGGRFVSAGLLMLAYAFARGAKLPATARDWRGVLVPGAFMLIGGNGLVTWSEQWIPSNQAALMVAASALWLAWMGTLGVKGERLNGRTIVGLALGFGGVAVLVSSGLTAHVGPPLAYAAMLASPVFWSGGSVYSKRHPVSCAPAMTAALQMLAAGVVFTILGLAGGETSRWVWDRQAMVALAYLIVFGSCIAYGAYFWLVHEVQPALLGTYAYINPAIAVLLGWVMLGERLTPPQLAGTVIILAGVIIVTLASRKPRTPVPAAQPAEETA
jgi:drug/metabolite transporter (DMT)-like permease